MLTAYKSDVFDGLQDFFVARDELVESQAMLSELGDVIRRHQLEKYVGMCLLHKHFHLATEERLVEEFVGNNAYIKPTTDYTDALPYMWMVKPSETPGEWVWYPLEFVRNDGSISEAIARMEAVTGNQDFLNEIAAKLSELGLSNMFGISILHRDAIKIAEGEILVESTDDQQRVLTFASVPRPSVDPATLTQTLWKFPAAGGVESLAECSHCTHCTHCTHA